MTIRIKLLFSVLATVILISTAGLVTYQRTQQINKEVKKTGVAQEIVQVATIRRGLILDYYRFHEERPKAQWQSLLNAQTILTQSELFDTPDEQSVLTKINETSEQIKSIFAELVTNYEKPKSSPAEFVLSRELEQVLVSQLLAKIQTNISRVYTLSDASLARVSTAQNTLVFAAGASMAVLLFFLMALFFFFNKFIAKPLTKLQEAAARIASLDFSTTTTTTGSNSNDEIGKLSRAFNTMVVKLKESYTTLEQRVVERTAKLAEKTQEAENSQKATLNVLEDLSVEKIKVETSVKDLEKFKLALDNTSEQVVITDSEGIVIYANRAVERITGYMPEEAVGKKSGVLWKSPMPKEYYEKLWNTIKKEKKVFVDEIQNKRKNGEVYTAAISISPLFNTAGEVIYFVSIERDITKEKDIDKAKTEFVSLASHQLRTPLSTVNWYSEMLLAGDVGKFNEKQKKYLDEVYKGNQRMVELVNALLNVSRIELGTFVIEPKPINLVELAQSVIDEQKPQIDENKITLSASFEKSIPLIQADPKLLRMVVQNLLSNAVKYTAEGGKIEISLALYDGKKDVLLKISDTGYGIPKAQQDKIFTKLFRADNVRDKDTEGTGLGLYIVKSVVENSGGMIWFESEENKGTTFYVTLPIAGMKKSAEGGSARGGKEGTRALS